jgi:acyl-CoA dehydrogenase
VEIALTSLQKEIDTSVRRVCSTFSDAYWQECDEACRFPEEFYAAMAKAGWLGITMPEDVGGSGLGVTEAAIMMHAVAASGGSQAAASSIHINLLARTQSSSTRRHNSAGDGYPLLLRVQRKRALV